MKFDILLAGVGGQGVLLLANLIARAAASEGWTVKQSDLHGMSQRGGSVTAHLRLSDGAIASALIGRGTAAMILGLEPLESLRYLDFLSPDGIVITATDPVRNLSSYPDVDEVLAALNELPEVILVHAAALAKGAGLARATNIVMAGAAARWLPVRTTSLEDAIRTMFRDRGAEVVERNLAAFKSGQEASCTVTP